YAVRVLEGRDDVSSRHPRHLLRGRSSRPEQGGGHDGSGLPRPHGALSVSMYPTPRTVWMSGTPKPRSILFLSELMWTSTTLLMLSKWMSQTCSMMCDRVTGRSQLCMRNSSSAYSFGFRSIGCPARVTLRRTVSNS